MAKVDFFISYTKVDEEWAKWIAWELKKQGSTCIIQAEDFKPGGNFIQQMRSAIKNSRQTIAVLSPEYLKSKYATAELNAALANDPLGLKGKVVPVRVRPCRPTELMRDKVYIDLVDKPKKEAEADLIAGIQASKIGINHVEGGIKFPIRPRFPGSYSSVSSVSRPTALSSTSGNHKGDGSLTDSPPRPLRILFLASEAGTGLDLRGQFKQITAAINRSPHARNIQIKGIFDITAEDFLEALNNYSPHILHFSGKQDGGDILINSSDGGVTTISDIALAGLLRSLDDHIRLAVIDTCFSWRCAKSVSEVVDCSIGVKSDVYEVDANTYYVAFYRALASGRSLRDACGQATAALQFRQVPKKEIPELIVRRGIDPSNMVLVSKEKPAKQKARAAAGR